MAHDPSLAVEGMLGQSRIRYGRFTYGTDNLTIRQWDEGAALTIGNFCSIAPGITVFLGGNHRTDWITTFPFGHVYPEQLGCTHIQGHPSTKGDVRIGNDVWIGYQSTIMSGVTIGDGAVISANSTVVKNVEPYEIVGGNPAKHLRHRFTPEIRAMLAELAWWDLPLEQIRAMADQLSTQPTPELLGALLKTYRPPLAQP